VPQDTILAALGRSIPAAREKKVIAVGS